MLAELIASQNCERRICSRSLFLAFCWVSSSNVFSHHLPSICVKNFPSYKDISHNWIQAHLNDQSHGQWLCFQIGSHFEGLGAKTSTYEFWGYNLTHNSAIHFSKWFYCVILVSTVCKSSICTTNASFCLSGISLWCSCRNIVIPTEFSCTFFWW